MSGELASFEVDGYQLVYQDLGEGTPVLLVHGSLCDYRYWQWQLRSLGERHRLIVPSLRHYYPERGTGRARTSPAPATSPTCWRWSSGSASRYTCSAIPVAATWRCAWRWPLRTPCVR